MNDQEQTGEGRTVTPVTGEEAPSVIGDATLLNVGMGAISGGLAGAVGGPVCTIMGAAVGAFAGGVGTAEEENDADAIGGDKAEEPK